MNDHPPGPDPPSSEQTHDSLWLNGDFRSLWIAETISQFGSHLSIVALPLLAVFVLGASPAQMGYLTAAGTAPFLMVGLFVGVWVDRVRRRPLMIAADFLRGLLLLSVPITWGLGILRIEMLYVVALLSGSLTVVFDVAWQAFLPSVVVRRQLVDANGKMQLSASVAQVAGPGLGGGLVGLAGAPLTILFDALSYLVSGVFLFRIRAEDAPNGDHASDTNLWCEVLAGLRMTFHIAVLRALIYSRVIVTLAAGIFFAVYVLFMVDSLDLGPAAVGLVLAMGGVGSLAGAAIAEPIVRRFGEGWTVIGGQFAFGVFGITLPLAVFFPSVALPMVIVSEFAQWMSFVISNVGDVSIRQASVSTRFLGRVSSVFQFFGRGLTPIGALAGGLLGELVGVPATIVLASVGFLLAFLFVLFSPLRSFRIEGDTVG